MSFTLGHVSSAGSKFYKPFAVTEIHGKVISLCRVEDGKQTFAHRRNVKTVYIQPPPTRITNPNLLHSNKPISKFSSNQSAPSPAGMEAEERPMMAPVS